MIHSIAAWFDRSWKTWLGHFGFTLFMGLLAAPFGYAETVAGLIAWGYTFRELDQLKDDVVYGTVIYWRDHAGDTIGPWVAWLVWVLA